MSYTVEWYSEKRIVLATFSGEVTFEEYLNFSDTLVEMFNEGIAPVHLILEAASVKEFPQNLTALKNAGKYLSHPNRGWNVLVGGSALLAAFAQIISRLTGIEYYQVSNLETAITFLERQDSTLQPHRMNLDDQI